MAQGPPPPQVANVEKEEPVGQPPFPNSTLRLVPLGQPQVAANRAQYVSVPVRPTKIQPPIVWPHPMA